MNEGPVYMVRMSLGKMGERQTGLWQVANGGPLRLAHILLEVRRKGSPERADDEFFCFIPKG